MHNQAQVEKLDFSAHLAHGQRFTNLSGVFAMSFKGF
jgi:hypothetical protein